MEEGEIKLGLPWPCVEDADNNRVMRVEKEGDRVGVNK
jgi:hypothetical protein